MVKTEGMTYHRYIPHEGLREGQGIRLGGREGVIQWIGDDHHYPTVCFLGGKIIEQMDLANFPLLEVDERPLTFVECDACRAKSGSPSLCEGCQNNRRVIEELKKV